MLNALLVSKQLAVPGAKTLDSEKGLAKILATTSSTTLDKTYKTPQQFTSSIGVYCYTCLLVESVRRHSAATTVTGCTDGFFFNGWLARSVASGYYRQLY